MAKIPLRAYCKDVENLIERGEIEQAVAHARNILRAYPKHLETYRLLGKAYLESQRYSEAADILQRVLSVIPDDFFAQIGMSIIREDEGNLDASIWHMERAYEVQPFNPAVQDELRRLYGRRDGIEPPKIRLTRGALVRMYARGELYPQAIAEIRAALAEDPQRLDLRVLLARLYYQLGQKNDAAEVCSELIGKLPYCYEANRLLAEILPTTSRASETPKFQQRIFALDPYEAFISPSAPTSAQVPDQAVMVEQFLFDQAAEEAQAPDWTRDVGVDWEDQKEEALPDWLNALKPEATGTAAAAGEALSVFPAPEDTESQELTSEPAADGADLIPDWMKSAGWEQTDRTADEIMAEQAAADATGAGAGEISAFAQPAEESGAVEAEIPDWLQAIAPPDAQDKEAEQERSEWLENILANPNETVAPAPEPPAAEAAEVETAAGTEAPESAHALAGDEEIELPAWMAGFGAELPQQEQAEAPQAEAPAEEEIPDWLKQLKSGEEQPSAPTQPPADLEPIVFEDTSDFISSTEGSPELVEGGLPEWLKVATEETPEVEAGEEETAAEPMEQDAEAQPAQEAGLPDWLSGLSEDAETGLAHPAVRAEAIEEEPGEVKAFAAEEAVAMEAAQGAEGAMPDLEDTDAVMAWLESLAARQGADEATLITPPEQRSETPPEWISREMDAGAAEEAKSEPEMEAQPEAEELPTAAELFERTPPEEAEQPEAFAQPEAALPEAVQPESVTTDLSDEAAAMAWLESLAAKQGADEDTLLTTPEERRETPPEWVLKEAEAAQLDTMAAMETSTELSQPEEGEPFAAAEAPETGAVQEVEPQEGAAEIPFVQAPEAETPQAPELSDMEAAMAWLESLAAKQGADEATLTTSPEERSEVPPAWVVDEISASDSAEEALASQEGAETLPNWLGEGFQGTEDLKGQIGEGLADLSGERSTAWMGELEDAAPAEDLHDMALLDQAPDAVIEDTEEAAAAQAGLEESPEWLKRLELEEESPSAAANEEAMPWAMESKPEGQLAQEEAANVLPPEVLAETSGAAHEPGEGEELPNWLKLGEDAEASQLLSTPTAPEEQVPDWLMGLEEEMEAETGGQGEGVSQPVSDYRAAWEPEAADIETATGPEEETVPSEAAQPEAAGAIQPPAWVSPSGPGALEALRAAINRGQVGEALNGYNQLIEQEQNLDEVIHDLRDALYRFPVDIDLWQTLGDACSRNNQLQDALDAYTKAEELLR